MLRSRTLQVAQMRERVEVTEVGAGSLKKVPVLFPIPKSITCHLDIHFCCLHFQLLKRAALSAPFIDPAEAQTSSCGCRVKRPELKQQSWRNYWRYMCCWSQKLQVHKNSFDHSDPCKCSHPIFMFCMYIYVFSITMWPCMKIDFTNVF